MKYNKFVTEIFKGNLTFPNEIKEKYLKWASFEKELDPIGRNESTTVTGWQYSFNQSDKVPDWLDLLLPYFKDIKDEIQYNTVKSMWTILYEPGGFQDPHFHQPGNQLYTVIINISGQGDLLLYDPRQLAIAQGESIIDVEHLEPGDWIALPSWLIHSTRPCQDQRIILVMDVHK